MAVTFCIYENPARQSFFSFKHVKSSRHKLRFVHPLTRWKVLGSSVPVALEDFRTSVWRGTFVTDSCCKESGPSKKSAGREKGKSDPPILSLTLKLVSLLLFHCFTASIEDTASRDPLVWLHVIQFIQLQQINTQDILFHLLLKHSALTAVSTAPTL